MTALLVLMVSACGPKATGTAAPVQALGMGLDHVEVDLIRPYPGATKIYVQATLPDGESGLFLVDTGAGITALSTSTAERLGIQGEDRGGRVQGLSGEAVWLQAQLPSLDIGGLIVRDIDIAVGIPGMPEQTGAMPVDGILGNNVWGDYILAVDYPADTLELGLPGTVEVPRHAQPMQFDGNHIRVEVDLLAGESGSRDTVEQLLVLEVDTGARMLLLSGPISGGLAEVATEGEEPIFGLGASDRVPVSAFYRRTRRVPIQQASLGGVTLKEVNPATWLNYDGGQRIGPSKMTGLAGHELLSEYRAVFDYPGGRFALEPSKGQARELDGHAIFLAQDIEKYGEVAPGRGLVRARYRLYLDQDGEAEADLLAYIDSVELDPAAQVLLARMRRYEGDQAGYEAALAPLNAGDLFDEGELNGRINGLILAGRLDEAWDLAEQALAERAEEAGPRVALADAHMAKGELPQARAALAEGARIAGNPDAYLKRRARVALKDGDRIAALAYLRQQLSYYPSDGEALWFYATLVSDLSDFEPTFRADLERAMGRLHPEGRPVDFLAAAWGLLGEPEKAEDLLLGRVESDCLVLKQESSQQNCKAWYMAMAGQGSDEALELVQEALAAEGPRADFLDTLAVVHLVRKEYAQAAQAAQQAAELAPERFYHLWQAERMAEMAELHAASPLDAEG
ncbi:MAG: Flp pilus assembly protein TadD [Cognaticolwellia sp.]|jgi:Flp pilus assembly protein TadD